MQTILLVKLCHTTFISSQEMNSDCVVTVDGFYVCGRYVAKELTILFDENNYQHFMFNCPKNLVLSNKDVKTVEFAKRLNGLELENNSFLPYSTIECILSFIKDCYIQTAGFQAKSFLESYLPKTEVKDLCIEFGFKYPKTLQQAPCFVQHPSRYCTLSKARTIYSAIQIFNANFASKLSAIQKTVK